MSIFARGLMHHHSLRLPSSLRLALSSARSQCAHPRAATRATRVSPAVFLRRYVKPSQILREIARPTVRSYMVADPAIRTVLATKEAVLLYKAPDRQLYMVAVYGLACGLIAAGLFTLKWRYELPEGLAFFVGPTYVLVGAIMIVIGAYIFTAPVGRCSSIELIPSTLGGTGVQLRILARTVPFTRDRVIIASIGEATINEKTTPVYRELQEAERARRQSLSEDLKGMFIIRRMWEVAARWMDQRWTSFFLRFKFSVLRFGIVKLSVHGDRWKIDCQGYMREDGLAIDRLIAQE